MNIKNGARLAGSPDSRLLKTIYTVSQCRCSQLYGSWVDDLEFKDAWE